MKIYKFLFVSIPFLIILGILASCSSTVMQTAESFPSETVNFKPQKGEEWQLPNGLTVIYKEDKELPLVYGGLFFPGGSYWQKGNEMGSVAAMGTALREGGAGNRTPEELDKDLDKLAAGVASSFAQESGKVNFSCLDKDIDAVFEIFSDVILRPRFDQKKLELWKGNTIDSIKRRIENPEEVVHISFMQIAYGSSPYGRASTVKDIEMLTRADLIRKHNEFVKPGKAILTVGGNISKEKLSQLLSRYFSSWKGQPVLPPLPEINEEPKPGIYFVKLPVTQANVIMGQLGVPRLTSDYPSIDAFNEIFGSSGFGLSRLFARIRTELGLAYSVYGGARSGLVRGLNVMMVQTKSESVDVATIESMNILKEMQTTEVPTDELEEVQRSVENSFVFNYASTSQLLNRQASIKLLNYPSDFDETYIPKIRAVTPASIKEVANKRWELSKFVIVVVGNEDAYDRLAKRLEKNPGPLAGLSLKTFKFDQKLLY